MSDAVKILMRPLKYKQQPGWSRSSCPVCGQPCWDTGAMERYGHKFKRIGCKVSQMCDDCGTHDRTQAKSEQMMLEV